MSEGYERTTGGAEGRARFPGGTGTASDHAGIPFRGQLFRVSGSLRDELRARRAAPDGWMRHA
ncbi:hypothetical protein JCM4814A_24730 [Streptomyces phaeofaciens JCM 4814]|uniref:Uncharacterized protein n=1 Tax=Streptomyces phaeofaciens TaxID=68254 RepID=A0A918H4J1_9ACTN|nr:hypothetical protein GCM10010226_10060 [Streptomyces phaeofaciens]